MRCVFNDNHTKPYRDIDCVDVWHRSFTCCVCVCVMSEVSCSLAGPLLDSSDTDDEGKLHVCVCVWGGGSH